MYNLFEYSKNNSKTSGSLWNYYRDELTDETNDNNGLNKIVTNSKSFKYKTSITRSTYNLNSSFKGRIISKFVGLKSKMYSLISVDDAEITKAKGVNKKIIKT